MGVYHPQYGGVNNSLVPTQFGEHAEFGYSRSDGMGTCMQLHPITTTETKFRSRRVKLKSQHEHSKMLSISLIFHIIVQSFFRYHRTDSMGAKVERLKDGNIDVFLFQFRL